MTEASTEGSKARERLERGAVWVGALLLAVPMVFTPYPPMTDFPHHEALVALLRNLGDASLYPPGMYVRNLGQPNQLFHIVAWAFSFPLGVTLACKVVAALSVAAVPLGALRFARHVGATALTALALAPVAYGWLFTWGFVNNLMALGILFALLPLVDEVTLEPSVAGLVKASVGALVMYLAHELVMFVYLGAVLWLALLRARSPLGFLQRAIPAFVGLGAAFLQIRLQETLKTATVRMVPNVWMPIGAKLREIPATLVGGSDRTMRLMVFLLTIGFVVALAVLRELRERKTRVPARSVTWNLAELRDRGEKLRFEILAAGAFGLYLIAPFTFNGAILVHERFLAPAFGIVAVMAGLGIRGGLPLAAIAGALPIAALLMMLPWFGDAARNYRSLETLFALLPHNTSVAAVDLDRNQGGRPFTVASGLSRVLVRSGGRVLYSFAESTVAPVMVAKKHQWNEPSARVMFDNTKFRPAHDLTRFRYLLVHATEPGRVQITGFALRREAKLLSYEGEWALFESRLPVVPWDAPDVPLPEPHPETLGRRLFFVDRRVREVQRRSQEAGDVADEPMMPEDALDALEALDAGNEAGP